MLLTLHEMTLERMAQTDVGLAGYTTPGQIGLHVTSAGGILLGNILNRYHGPAFSLGHLLAPDSCKSVQP